VDSSLDSSREHRLSSLNNILFGALALRHWKPLVKFQAYSLSTESNEQVFFFGTKSLSVLDF
jgi:hypothetical protein